MNLLTLFQSIPHNMRLSIEWSLNMVEFTLYDRNTNKIVTQILPLDHLTLEKVVDLIAYMEKQ